MYIYIYIYVYICIYIYICVCVCVCVCIAEDTSIQSAASPSSISGASAAQGAE